MIRISKIETIELEKATDNITAQIDEINKKYDEGVISENERIAQMDEVRARLDTIKLRRNNLNEFVRELYEKLNDQKE